MGDEFDLSHMLELLLSAEELREDLRAAARLDDATFDFRGETHAGEVAFDVRRDGKVLLSGLYDPEGEELLEAFEGDESDQAELEELLVDPADEFRTGADR